MKIKLLKLLGLVVIISVLIPAAAVARVPGEPTKPRPGDIKPVEELTPEPVTLDGSVGRARPIRGQVVGEAKRATGPAVYIIHLEEPALPAYEGGVPGLKATSPRATGRTRLDANTADSAAYRDYLSGRQAEFICAMETALDRSVQVRFQYQAALNGMSVELTPEDAVRVAALEGVKAVLRNWEEHALTDVGPAWISAESIWDGSATGVATMGEGIVIGVLDTGINMDHPSFADVGGDGYDHTNPRGKFYGWCDPADPYYDDSLVCNDKLIGVWSGDADSPEDAHFHGSHVASTAAGNVISATVEAPTIELSRTISGVAPHANIIAYNIEGTPGSGSAPGDIIVAATERAILDGVDVINYSFGGGGGDPWSNAVHWLNVRDAGIFVATSAGNDGPGAGTIGSPANAPWMLSVGMSTHNRMFRTSLVGMSGGDTGPPVDMVGAGITAGYGAAPIVHAGQKGDPLCLAAFPANTWTDDEIVVCDRGQIARVDKGANVLAGGAGGLVLANTAAQGESINDDAHHLPATHIGFADGEVLRTWLASGTGHTATIVETFIDLDPANADIMDAGSSRGPNYVPDILKPDVAAPGVGILAASMNGIEFELAGGTSMASPHAAGAAALLRALHPSWSPAEIQSALMTTAWTDTVLDHDSATPADPFAMGAGRVAVDAAALTGLVLDETKANFEAADPGLSGDPATLNLASMSNDKCLQECSWERTVESVLLIPATYTVTVRVPPGMIVTVDPLTFTIPPGGAQVVSVTADVGSLPLDEWCFAEVGLDTNAVQPALLFQEEFEGAFPPPSWTVITNTGAGWNTNTYWGAPNLTSGGGRSADADSYAFGGGMNTELWSPAIDLTGAALPVLTYESNFQDYAGYGDAWLDISTDGGANWTNLTYWTDDHGPTSEVVDLSAYVAEDVILRWHYDDNNGAWTWYWQVDHVSIWDIGTGTEPVSDLHMPVVVKPAAGSLPDLVEMDTRRSAGSYLIEGLEAMEITGLTVNPYGLVQATITPESLVEDPTYFDPYDTMEGAFYVTETVAAGSKRLVAEITASEAPDIDLFVGLDLDADGPEESEELCSSTTGSWNEYCEVTDPDAGTWWVLVQNWYSSGSPPDDVVLATAVVPGTDSGNMTFAGPASVPQGEPFDLRLFWDTPPMQAGDRWYGAFALGTDEGNPGNIATVPVNIIRHDDDVVKTASPAGGGPGWTITYTIAVEPNVTEEDLTYYLTDTIPAGLTYVPDSASATLGVVDVAGDLVTWSGVLPSGGIPKVVEEPAPYGYLPLSGFVSPAGCPTTSCDDDGWTIGGLDFCYLGEHYDAVVWATNGYIYVDDLSSVTFLNQALPDPTVTNGVIAPWWTDLDFDGGDGFGGGAWYVAFLTDGVDDYTVFEWENAQLFADPSSCYTFQIWIVDGTDDIWFTYGDITGDTSFATVGFEDVAGLVGESYYYDTTGTLPTPGVDLRIVEQTADVIYQVTVDGDLFGILTNQVLHDTDNPGSQQATTSVDVDVRRPVYVPLVMRNHP